MNTEPPGADGAPDRTGVPAGDDLPPDEGEVRLLLQELRVHQVELELQNEELRSQRVRYQDLYDLAPAGYFTLTREGEILETNIAGARMLGATRDDLIGRRLGTFVAPASAGDLRTFLGDLFERHVGLSCDLVIAPADGGADVVASFEAAVDPGLGTAVAVALDLTDRRQVEERERAVALQAADAEHARMIAQVAGGVAHDLNNLLTVVLGYAEVVATNASLDLAARDAIAQIGEASSRAAEITGQLLAFGRRQPRVPEELDLYRFLEASRPLVSAILGSRVELEVRVPDGAAWISSDINQLNQVLLNLASNGRDAMPSGGTLVISGSIREVAEHELDINHGPVPAGRYVALEVADEGVGIDAAVLPRIAEPFFTTKAHGLGSGLGFAAVDGIVAQSGGHWHVESAPGAGTRVTVLFPMLRDRLTAESDGGVSGAALLAVHDDGDAAAPPRGARAVLVVDDEPAIARLCGDALGRVGYDVVLAGTAGEALGLLGERAFTAVVTDIAMTGMDGIEFADRARSIDPALPFLFISGYAFERSAAAGIRAGDAFLQKPFGLAELVSTVSSIIKQRVNPTA